jgi:DNA-binding NarL/FixJ family response regulator
MRAKTALTRDSVPIEGLGFWIQSTSLLRQVGITSVGKLRDVLDGKEAGLRILEANEAHREFLQSPFVRRELTAQLAVFDKHGPVPYATLTRVETQVLHLVVEGRSNKTISARLGINETTVEARLKTLFRKIRGRCAPYGE